MKIITAFRDIIDHLLIINGIEWVRIEGASTSCVLKTLNKDKTVIVKVVLDESIEEMIGVFGIYDIAHLNKILRAPGFDTTASSAKFIDSESGVESYGGGYLQFDNGAGQIYDKSVVGKLHANERLKVPPLKPLQFDIEFTPDKVGIALLKYWSRALREFDGDNVVFANESGDVVCRYHFGGGLKHQFIFKKSAGVLFQKEWKFSTEPILAVLSLYPMSKSVSISFCELGLMKIDVDSGLAKYRYLILPKLN
jgi:hypothetical protein